MTIYSGNANVTYVQTAKITVDIVTLDEAKLWLDVTHSKHDELIKALISAAVNLAEKFMNRDILTTTWENYRSSFVELLDLRRGGFQSVTSVEYLLDDVYTTLATTEYTVRIGGIYGIICEMNPPAHDDDCNAVKITFKSGFGDDKSFVPDAIKTGIKQHVAFLYENRGDCGGDLIPTSVMAIYEQYRIIDIVGSDSGVCL